MCGLAKLPVEILEWIILLLDGVEEVVFLGKSCTRFMRVVESRGFGLWLDGLAMGYCSGRLCSDVVAFLGGCTSGEHVG